MDGPKNAETLLAIWKAYDNGDLSVVRNDFADTVDVRLRGGETMHMSRDSVIAGIQGFRSSLAGAVDEVTAVTALKCTDKNEHWVLIWGMEKDTYKNGKTDSVYLQESWRFTEDGKANMLFQYGEAPTPAPRKMKK